MGSTDNEEKFLDFIEYPERDSKPRGSGRTMAMATTTIPEDFLNRYGDYIDVVKLLDSTQWAPRDMVIEDIERYKEHGLEIQVGGIPHEAARVQGVEDQYLETMEALGIDWIEYETHVEKPSVTEIESDIRELKDRGFAVAGEVGSKWFWQDETRHSKTRVNPQKTLEAFEQYLDAGCDKVYWEGLVVGNLIGRDLDNREGQKIIEEVVERVGLENVFFEIWAPNFTHLEHGRLWAWLVHRFGPEVNIANVQPNGVPLLESIRRGVLFDMDHPYIRWLAGGEPTKDWWRVESPPYDVGIDVE